MASWKRSTDTTPDVTQHFAAVGARVPCGQPAPRERGCTMGSKYEQLCELYTRANGESNKRRDDTIALASALLTEVLNSFGVPDDLKPTPSRTGKSRPAVEVCRVPWDDNEPMDQPELAPVTVAVTTEDGELYKFGIVVRIYSKDGIPPHSVLFRIHMRHKLGSAFDVMLADTGEARTFSVSGRNQPLSEFGDDLFGKLYAYFAAAVRGEQNSDPIGFKLLKEST
jgi:hypothetical protein